MKKKLALGFLAASLVAALLLAAPASKPPQAPLIAVAPQVQLRLLSGETLATSALRGKVFVLSFWATYCGPCLKEMPMMAATYREFAPRGVELIAVAVSKDDRARVGEFAAAHALPFKVAFDAEGVVAREFGRVRITPSTFVVDREGRVLKRYVGQPDWRELHALLERI
jgi:peroxiredoxin